MKFKSKLISTAVVAAVGMAAGTAQAVDLAVDGQGQVLLYPYYTVQSKNGNGIDTYFSIVNSDSVRGKAVKVRVIEAKNSREVLDFNLYLSPNDVFTAALTRDSAGNGLLRTWDESCTAPEIRVNSGTGAREASFVNYAYTGTNADWPADTTLARAREGYLEVIQMGDLVAGYDNAAAHDTFANALHDSTGKPGNCAQIRSDWLPTTAPVGFPTTVSGVYPPTGGLSGGGTIINVAEGTDVTYDAVAIERFYNSTSGALHYAPGSISPNLTHVSPKTSVVFDGTDVVMTNWGLAIEPGSMPVSAILMRDTIINEYAVADQPVGLSTDWVVTFPTKNHHIEQALFADLLPFTVNYDSTGDIVDTCQPVDLTAYDREEGIQTSDLIFSPPPPEGEGNSVCWEANVISMANGSVTSNALGGINTRMTLPLPYSAGWLRLQFVANTTQPFGYRNAPAGATMAVNMYTGSGQSGLDATYYGLPVVGFAALTFVNNATTSNYGGSFTHRYNRNVTFAN